MSAAEIMEKLLAADLVQLQREVKQLVAIRDWAVRLSGLAVGDKVIISTDMPCAGGWLPYAGALQGGTATIKAIDFAAMHDRWYADVMLDREWSVGHQGRVFWHGPVAETPEGMEPPTAYDQQRHPDGRKHTFMIGLRWLRKADDQ